MIDPISSLCEVRSNNLEAALEDNVRFGKRVVIGPNCKRLSIGFGSFIGNDVYIDVPELEIGDYVTIHHGSIIHGKRTIIGHNCWFGHYTIIDSLGGLTRIGNNVGVGAHSQLWSHMKFGDVLNGCRWNSAGQLLLDDDVWLVGHCIVGPIHAKSKAMLMTGSVAVKDLEENRIYAGSPAADVTDRLGSQFRNVPLAERVDAFAEMIRVFSEHTKMDPKCFAIVEEFDLQRDPAVTQFLVRDRLYWPRRTDAEYQFIRYMLYEKAKWLPWLPS